jgi:hypothetical protein
MKGPLRRARRSTTTLLAAALAASGLAAERASAQEAAAIPAPAAAQDAGPPPAATDAELSRIEPAFNVEFGSPLWLSANAGIRIPLGGLLGKGYGHGLLVQVQPGIGGGSVNLGWVPVSFGAQGTQAIAVGVKARLLRTWGSPWGTEPGRTYGGFEVAAVVGVKLAVGVLWKLDDGTGDDTVVTWGIGIGM